MRITFSYQLENDSNTMQYSHDLIEDARFRWKLNQEQHFDNQREVLIRNPQKSMRLG